MKKEGGLVLKLPSLWYVGIPDRLILLPKARVFFVELKRKGKTARKNQAGWIRTLRQLGFTAGVVAGPEALQKFIETHITFDRMTA